MVASEASSSVFRQSCNARGEVLPLAAPLRSASGALDFESDHSDDEGKRGSARLPQPTSRTHLRSPSVVSLVPAEPSRCEWDALYEPSELDLTPPAPAKGCNVYVRLRPESVDEIAQGGELAASVQPSQRDIHVQMREPGCIEPKLVQHRFTMDRVFDMNTTQEDFFGSTAASLVQPIVEGFSASVLAYGQTGAGKTYTMIGAHGAEETARDQAKAAKDPVTRGLIPRLIERLFKTLRKFDSSARFSVRCSFIEIYNEHVRDLLTPVKANLKIREAPDKGLIVTNATEVPIADTEESIGVIKQGTANRMQAETSRNQHSSRSHAVFVLTLRRENLDDCSFRVSQVYLVDLAGSEKLSKTEVQSQERLRESTTINQSLLALGNVISALTKQQHHNNSHTSHARGTTAHTHPAAMPHVPYRDSKLTRLLQNSFGGRSYCTVILCCSPHSHNARETIATLRFGDRANKIHNKPEANATTNVAELQKALQESQKQVRTQSAELRRAKGVEKRLMALLQAAVPMLGQDSLSCLQSMHGGAFEEVLHRILTRSSRSPVTEIAHPSLPGIPGAPQEMIMSFLPPRSLGIMARLSRSFHASLTRDDVWRCACESLNGGPVSAAARERFLGEMSGRYPHITFVGPPPAFSYKRYCIHLFRTTRQAHRGEPSSSSSSSKVTGVKLFAREDTDTAVAAPSAASAPPQQQGNDATASPATPSARVTRVVDRVRPRKQSEAAGNR
ncbi:unnamed protein product [Vitrella brassicaformis CCMP3155]|uniref:Kinesin-like protein n=1 Tax=Vitrella brassicaformis (strain CCMP3155) TaxID=1169540 RepID=A0A0G4EWN5_VITBC|nr:unnamed protein product [Vitrella brassicaformis CCMP3155]|eukprot:CEM02479.1 unnamed protein product [Vitrella brassicaformis CCMP3155]